MTGDIIELPKNSTVIDFAYKLHTDLGDTLISAIVNNKAVEPEYVLHNKDKVKIITDIMAFGPKDEWYDIVQTTKAKKRIKEFNKK